jgi:hypothetical protein
MTNFWVKSTKNLIVMASVSVQKLIIYNFMIFVAAENGRAKKNFPFSFSAVVGSGIRDPGSGINIPDQQHCLKHLQAGDIWKSH